MNDLNIIIMAGGLGKRMQSDIPKVLHEINGVPMIVKILLTANKLNPDKILIVVGIYKSIIKTTIERYINIDNVIFIDQPNALGTGNAILCCKDTLMNFSEDSKILILSGDVPLISREIMISCIDNIDKTNKCKIVTTYMDNPSGLGRINIINNKFHSIIESRDCNHEQVNIKLVNCGIYGINNKILCKYLPYIYNNNSQNEYYLTDIIQIIKENEQIDIDMYNIDKEDQYMISGVNTKEQLTELNEIIKDI